MILSLALLALALDTQDAQTAQAPVSPPAEEQAISEEARAAAYAYAQQIAAFAAETVEREAGGHYALINTETLAAELAEHFAVVMTYGDAPAGEYNMEMRATFFSVTEGATPSGMYCAEGVPSTMVDQMVEDSAGNELRFRGCWGGEQDAETGRLTAGVIYQMDRNGHYALYQGLIDGPDEEGLRERLLLLEPAIGVLVTHTVFVPDSE
jgi:hypothetical protein